MLREAAGGTGRQPHARFPVPPGRAASRAAAIRPVELRTEGRLDPTGIGTAEPRFSWKLAARPGLRGIRQAACQIEVACEAMGPLWDSGQVPSSTPWLTYGGPALGSRRRCSWRVRVWDGDGRVSAWSERATFETGLLGEGDWQASWIAAAQPAADARLHFLGVSRIWLPSRLGAATRAAFRHRFTLEAGGIASARLQAAGGAVTAWINGVPVGSSPPDATLDVDVAGVIAPGENVLTLEARPSPGDRLGLIGALVVTDRRGVVHRFGSDDSWSCASQPPEGWHATDCDDSMWPLAAAVARWGDPPWGRQPAVTRPVQLLRRRFRISRRVRQARLYATALGVYELYLNGVRVSDECLAPGWTDYRRRVEYQAHDVTALLSGGENVLGAALGDGWYAGHVALWGPGRYGREPLFSCQLEVVLEDGTRQLIASDGEWQASEGAIRYADLLMGQTIDHRCADPSWSPVTAAEPWGPVRVSDLRLCPVARQGPPIRVMEERRPLRVDQRDDGSVLVDMGQNMVGWIRLAAHGPRGRRITARYAEALDPDGGIYRSNLRSAQATDEFILGGEGEEVFEPRFTYHGFRYVEIAGYPGALPVEAITGCVVHADMRVTGGFECSRADLNRLQQNIVWSQRGNFLTVPTDCPQRDERLGWTGDAQVFCATAMFNMDVQRFFEKWLEDVLDAQLPNGAIPDVVPEIAEIGAGAAGWGDAVVIVPWTMYRLYGDRRAAERALPAIRRWLDYLTETSDDLVRPSSGYGDWLSVDAETPKDLVGTAYFAYSARLAAELARALDLEGDAVAYERLFEGVRRAFRRRFVRGGGRLVSDTQAASVVALHAGLLEPHEVQPVAARLVADLRSRNWHLSTGFLGTPWLLPTLAEHGHLDVAYRLLLQDTYPSWLYQVGQGATTMWERWDTFTDGKGFHTSETTAGIWTDVMNSLNHYAYGSVGAFMYEHLGGLRASGPGYETVRIDPRPAPGVAWARTWVESVRGRIECRWRAGRTGLRLDLLVPPGVTAEVVLPARAAEIEERASPLAGARGVMAIREAGGDTVVVIGSGRYRFRTRDGGAPSAHAGRRHTSG